jgi:hypothetical protein
MIEGGRLTNHLSVSVPFGSPTATHTNTTDVLGCSATTSLGPQAYGVGVTKGSGDPNESNEIDGDATPERPIRQDPSTPLHSPLGAAPYRPLETRERTPDKVKH